MMNTNNLVKFLAPSGESTRKSKDKPNPETHHIWCNHGVYFTALTIHVTGYQKARVRVSLKTKDRAEAIERRDVLFAAMLAMEGYVSSPSLKHARSLPHHLKHAA
jgi:hypothetical protein